MTFAPTALRRFLGFPCRVNGAIGEEASLREAEGSAGVGVRGSRRSDGAASI